MTSTVVHRQFRMFIGDILRSGSNNIQARWYRIREFISKGPKQDQRDDIRVRASCNMDSTSSKYDFRTKDDAVRDGGSVLQ